MEESDIRNLVQLWGNIAKYSSDIAAYKRSVYLAYLSEGFTEQRSLELIKTI